MWVPTRALLQSLVLGMGTDTFTATAKLKTGIVALLRADFTPSVDLVYGDVTTTLANYNGYAPQALAAWTTPFVAEGELSLMQQPSITWRPTGSDTVNTIFGHILIGSDSVTLLAAEKFDAPIPLPNASSAFVDVIRFGLDPSGNYALSVVAP